MSLGLGQCVLHAFLAVWISWLDCRLLLYKTWNPYSGVGHPRDQEWCPLNRRVPSMGLTVTKVMSIFKVQSGPKFLSLECECSLNRDVPVERLHSKALQHYSTTIIIFFPS